MLLEFQLSNRKIFIKPCSEADEKRMNIAYLMGCVIEELSLERYFVPVYKKGNKIVLTEHRK